VLVVDDDASIRLLCRINLELDGYRVVEAATPDAARAAVAAERVDALLLDLHLGPVDARPLAAELRRDHPDLGIVLMTGSTDSVIQGFAADAVLGKPFDLDVFRSAVARAAGARRPRV
jgi:DNA-binding response OmpR family regulator